MSQQYLRAASLIVADAAGNGLDLSTLRIEFSVTHASTQTPRTLAARIWNVQPKTAALVQKEYTRVILSAGYEGSIGKLFAGSICQFKYGRESATDRYLDIIAADGDQAYSQGFVSQVLDAGWTAGDVHREVVSAASGLGLTAGTAPTSSQAGIRPKVLFGPIRDHCRVLAASTGTAYSITDEQLNFGALQVATTPSQQAVVLSPTTGLIGIPKQTIEGVEATCLLNSKIKADSYVTIVKDLIAQASVDTASGATNNGNLAGSGSQQSVAGLSPTGTYRVLFVDHYGDTRGEPWYSSVTCFADDGNAVMGQAGLIAVP